MREANCLRHPEGAWGWGAGLAALVVVLVPQLLAVAVLPQARGTESVASAAALVLDVTVLASGIFMYLHHRLTSSDSTAWLSIALIFVGVFGLAVTGLGASASASGPSRLTSVLVADLVALVTLLAMVLIAERTQAPFDPAALGLALGCAASVLAILAAAVLGPEVVPPGPAPWLALALVAGGTLVALEVRRLVTLPSWARDRLAVAVVALFVGRAALDTSATGSTAAHLLSAASSTLAAVLLLGTSLATLRLAIHDDRIVIAALQDQLAETADHARADRERLHEVRGTIAGIASAARLIHEEPPLPGLSRALLEEMLARESARLQRLVRGESAGPLRAVHVDDVLRPLVVSRRAQGQLITWHPTGLQVWCCEDDLAEVVNILLENAARHAPGATVAIFGRDHDDGAEIVVADSGPGIPAGERQRIFQEGCRGPSSRGQGLGLHVAQRLMVRSGGYVHIDESWHQGAAFVVGAMRVDPEVEGSRHDEPVRVAAQ